MITLQLWVALMASIMIHELGHVVAALLTGMRLERVQMGLFAGPSFQLGSTVVKFGWLPSAGFVSITGMDSKKKVLFLNDYREKSSSAKVLVLLGGCAAQFVVAMGIFMLPAYFNGVTGVLPLVHAACSNAYHTVLSLTTVWTSTTEVAPILTGAWHTGNVLRVLALVALLHSVLNIIPAPKLDGGRALAVITAPRKTGIPLYPDPPPPPKRSYHKRSRLRNGY